MPVDTITNERNFYSQNHGVFTVALWYKRPKTLNAQDLISKKDFMSLSCKDNHFMVTLAGKELVSCPMPEDDNWHHIVTSISATDVALYLDARKLSEKGPLPVLNANADAPTMIGSENNGSNFQGDLNRVTFFNHALAIDEVMRLYRRGMEKSVLDFKTTGNVFDYSADQIVKDENGFIIPIQVFENPPALRNPPSLVLPTVYPFHISLTNQKDNASPALYIVSDVARTTDVQNIDLVINNTTADTYQVDSFTLSFRKGTLHNDLTKDKAKKFCDILAAATGPKASVIPTEELGSIRFTVKKSATEKFSFEPDALTISLKGIYAAPGTGTRTSGYEIQFEGVQKMLNNNASGANFSFGRNAVLQVINHQGISHAPVHLGVLGNNFLLNNAADTQEIAIFMQSLDGSPLAMDTNTKFIFAFYASEKRDGTSIGNDACTPFGNQSEVNGIALGTLPANFWKDAQHHSEVDEHGRRDIIIKPTAAISTAFAAFKFNKIKLSGTPGLIKVHVTVENLPGYWDSTFEVTFIKGPMVMAGKENQVGINTLPVVGNALSVKGDTHLEGKLAVTKDIYLSGKLGIATNNPQHALEVAGDAYISGNLIIGNAKLDAYVCRAWGFFYFTQNKKSFDTITDEFNINKIKISKNDEFNVELDIEFTNPINSKLCVLGSAFFTYTNGCSIGPLMCYRTTGNTVNTVKIMAQQDKGSKWTDLELRVAFIAP